MDLCRPARVVALTRGATANPELWLCTISLWTLREGSSGDGRPDFQARPKNIVLNRSSSITGSPRPRKAKPAVAEKAGSRSRTCARFSRCAFEQSTAPIVLISQSVASRFAELSFACHTRTEQKTRRVESAGLGSDRGVSWRTIRDVPSSRKPFKIPLSPRFATQSTSTKRI
jgi:hypothetical protein